MRLLLSTMALLALTCAHPTTKAAAEPLVTISCEKPDGINISYGGASLQESVEAREKNQPEPPPTLKEPTKDGYAALPTFIIDSNKKKMTVIWSELREVRRQEKY